MLRGKDDRGDNLVIAREYIASGMRERLREILTLDLGPRTDLEIARKLRHDIGQERPTALDRRLLRMLDDERTLRPSARDPHFQALLTGRLTKLEELGLAREVVPGRWQVVPGADIRLRELGERGDIIRTMQRELRSKGTERATAEQIIHRSDDFSGPLVGRLVSRGLSDEHRDRQFLILDGLDGRSHYVDIGGDPGEALPEGSILRLSAGASAGNRSRAIRIDLLSSHSLGRMATADAATWLDRELISDRPEAIRDSGFGREARSALALRRQWLLDQGLAEEREGKLSYRRTLLSELEKRELLKAGQRLSAELGLEFSSAREGRPTSGKLSRRIDLVSGRFALIERSRDFLLVPWRPSFERQMGKEISGFSRSGEIRWEVGRQRQGPAIS